MKINIKNIFTTVGVIAALLVCIPVQAQTMCTMDARQCPDGSWVGRSGPNCEFVCPSQTGGGTGGSVGGKIDADPGSALPTTPAPNRPNGSVDNTPSNNSTAGNSSSDNAEIAEKELNQEKADSILESIFSRIVELWDSFFSWLGW